MKNINSNSNTKLERTLVFIILGRFGNRGKGLTISSQLQSTLNHPHGFQVSSEQGQFFAPFWQAFATKTI